MRTLTAILAIAALSTCPAISQDMDAESETSVPTVCRNLSFGPCKASPVQLGIAIELKQSLLDCLKHSTNPGKECFPEVATDFDWLEDAIVVGGGASAFSLIEGPSLLTVEPITVQELIAIDSVESVFEKVGPPGLGVFIPEYCLRAEWVEGSIPKECGGTAEALSPFGISLAPARR